MLAKTAHRSNRRPTRHGRAGNAECTQLALEALLGAQAAATRRPPFHVTPAHVLVGLIRQSRSGAGELLAAGNLTEDRVWAAFDYRKWRVRGLRRLRDPMFASGPRWTRAAREVVASAAHASRQRDTAVVDTIDLLAGIDEVDDQFANHLLAAAHIEHGTQHYVTSDAHLIELERSPTTQLPTFTALRKMHV